MSDYLTESEIVDSFRQAMADAGLPYSGTIEPDGKIHRITLDGEKRGKKTAWLILYTDSLPAGAFGSWKEGGGRHTWSAKGVKPMSDAERREFARLASERKAARGAAERETQAKAAAFAQAAWAAATVAVEHPYLTRKGIPPGELRVGIWEKRWTPPGGGAERVFQTPNTLLIPIRDARKNIVSLQGIFAEPQEIGGDHRDKDFVTGGRKRGCWFVIGKPTEVDGQITVLICEGYATGASAHAATGLGVVVAFDAGNLLPVALECRRLMPNARIVFLADNDQWTDKPVKNPGVTRATEAAAAISGLVASPWFSDVATKPTDFNDLQALQGPDEVRRQIMAVVAPQAVQAQEPEAPPPAIEEAMRSEEPDEVRRPLETNPFFTVLGYDREHIYIYQHERKMVSQKKLSDLGYPVLLTWAPMDFWERGFATGATGLSAVGKVQAANWLLRVAGKKKFFDPSLIRGRGAWRDDGRLVFHFGHRLWVDTDMVDLDALDSGFIYEQGKRLPLPADEPMSAEDGLKLITIAREFAWTRPASAILLAGWCALAPIGGALGWRPHIWLTGSAGCGKSTILNRFVHWLQNGVDLFANGNSTEAGIRQSLKLDALPILFEESEQNDQRGRLRVQDILALFRQASTQSDARTLKGSQDGVAADYMVQSMACLCSIQVGIEQQADLERIAILALRSKGDEGVMADDWTRIDNTLIEWHRDTTLPARLMRRSLMLLPKTLQNITVFANAAAKIFGSQREGDQYGAMLAGAWSLTHGSVATPEDARKLIAQYDWSDYTEAADEGGASRALSALLGSLIRIDGGHELSVYELVCRAGGGILDNDEDRRIKLDMAPAEEYLRRYGMRTWAPKTARGRTPLARGGFLLVSSSEQVKRLMERTSFAADLKGQLLRVPGAERHGNERFLGSQERSVAIPLAFILEGPPPTIDDRVTEDDIAF